MKQKLISPYNDITGKNICEGDILRVTTKYKRPEGYIRVDIVEVKFGEYPDGEEYINYIHCGWYTEVGTLPDIYGKSEIIGSVDKNPELLTNKI